MKHELRPSHFFLPTHLYHTHCIPAGNGTQMKCLESGIWTEPRAWCSPVCPDLTALNAAVIDERCEGPQEHGQKCSFTCQSGYYIEGQDQKKWEFLPRSFLLSTSNCTFWSLLPIEKYSKVRFIQSQWNAASYVIVCSWLLQCNHHSSYEIVFDHNTKQITPEVKCLRAATCSLHRLLKGAPSSLSK